MNLFKEKGRKKEDSKNQKSKKECRVTVRTYMNYVTMHDNRFQRISIMLTNTDGKYRDYDFLMTLYSQIRKNKLRKYKRGSK